MSKETKFLSTALCLLQGKYDKGTRERALVDDMTPERLLSLIREVRTAQGLTNVRDAKLPEYREEVGVPQFQGISCTAGLHVRTIKENGAGTPAAVKLFRLLPGETPENFNRVNGRITMSRLMTGLDGKLVCAIPEGRYVVEVSKGSEYVILRDSFTVEEKESVSKNYTLHRFIDLSSLGWYAGDLHHHSVYSSPAYGGTDDVRESAEEVACSMRAAGLTFGALSDHHNVYNHAVWRKQQTPDFLPIVSKEISTSNGHVLSLGVDEDVIYRIPSDEDRNEGALRREFYRIVRQIKDDQGLAQLNHPRDLQTSISWNPSMYDMIDIFDTMEIWNGSNPMMAGSTNDRAYRLWLRLLSQDRFIPATTGSDTHNIHANDYVVFMDELMDFRKELAVRQRELTTAFPEEIACYALIFDEVLPILEKWAETNLSSGGVRTYIHDPDACGSAAPGNQEEVLTALRRGHSFLTNGPILIPSIHDFSPGSHIKRSRESDQLEMEIRLYSNTPLEKVSVHTPDGVLLSRELDSDKAGRDLSATGNPAWYDYSFRAELPVGDAHYVFVTAMSDCTAMAISNPFILDPN